MVITTITNIMVIVLLVTVSTSGEMFGRCLIQQANIWHRCLTESLLYLHSFCNIYQYHYSAVFIIALCHKGRCGIRELGTLPHILSTSIPDICHFWYATALSRQRVYFLELPLAGACRPHQREG